METSNAFNGMSGTIEMQVFMTISSKLHKDETIVFDDNFTFELPKGCDELGWPTNTVISVKYRLIHDTLVKLEHQFRSVRRKYKKLVLLYYDKNDSQNEEGIVLYDDYNKSFRELLIVCNIVDFIQQNQPNKKFDQEQAFIQWTALYDKYKKIKARKVLTTERFSFFLGAGVSIDAGLPKWDALLDKLCKKKRIQPLDKSINSIIRGRYIINKYRDSKGRITDAFYHDLRSILYATVHPSNLIGVLAEVICKYWGYPFYGRESIITYNYDDLIEQEINHMAPLRLRSYYRPKKVAYPVYNKSRLIKKTSIPIYHVHGFLSQFRRSHSSLIVLGEKEYHKIYQEAYDWGNVEQLHALTRSSCFFIGLSMTDPNLRRLIDISNDGSEVNLVHFTFLRRKDYDVPFTEQMMRSFGIHCIWYDEHHDLPVLLARLWL